VTFDPTNGLVYVANYQTGTISVIDGLTVVSSIDLESAFAPTAPLGLGFDSITGDTYVANSNANNVSILRGYSLIGQIGGEAFGADARPSAVTFDSSDGYVYVSDSGSDNVTILNGSISYPMISSFRALPGAVELESFNASSTSLITEATGGAGPLSYTYTGLPAGCSSFNTATLSCSPSASGDFSITVYVNDSKGDSDSLTTSLTVYPRLLLDVSATQNPADVNESVGFSAGATGGTGDNSYSWTFGDGTSSSLASPHHSYMAVGEYAVQVWVNDTLGGSAVGSLSVSIVQSLGVTLTPSNASLFLGATLLLNAAVFGGAAPYSYVYSGLPPGCASVDSPSVGCLPTQSGVYEVTVNVSDQNGGTAIANVSLDVYFDFTVVSPPTVTVEHSFTIQIELVEGSVGPLNYQYAGLPSGCVTADTPALTCTPTDVGTYTVSVSIRDGQGVTADHTVMLRVVPPLASGFLSTNVLIAIVGTAVVVALLGVGLYRPRRTVKGPDSEAYAEYRLRRPGASREPSDNSAAGRTGPSSAPEPNASGDDSLSDLI